MVQIKPSEKEITTSNSSKRKVNELISSHNPSHSGGNITSATPKRKTLGIRKFMDVSRS
jgi:hypothetical protein